MSSALFLLDTNIVIYIRRVRPSEVLERFRQLRPGEAAISVVTYGELAYGVERSPDRATALAKLEEIVSLVPVLPLPIDAARAYGRLRAMLSAKGQMIGSNDLWIAAQALASNMTLVTNNTGEFTRVPDLKIENWVTATQRSPKR